jgi:hypothetical protein
LSLARPAIAGLEHTEGAEMRGKGILDRIYRMNRMVNNGR